MARASAHRLLRASSRSPVTRRIKTAAERSGTRRTISTSINSVAGLRMAEAGVPPTASGLSESLRPTHRRTLFGDAAVVADDLPQRRATGATLFAAAFDRRERCGLKRFRRLREIEDVRHRVGRSVSRSERAQTEVLLDELQDAAEIVLGVRNEVRFRVRRDDDHRHAST